MEVKSARKRRAEEHRSVDAGILQRIAYGSQGDCGIQHVQAQHSFAS